MTEKHTFLSPKGPNYLCLTCGNPDEHEIHGKTYAKRPVEGATGAREWLETFLGKVPPYKFLSTVNESGRAALANVLEAYTSSQLKKLDGVAQEAAEKIVAHSANAIVYSRQDAVDDFAAIISKLIAERLSK